MHTAEDVLGFWFPEESSRTEPADLLRQVEWWFRGGADTEIISKFSPLLERAERREWTRGLAARDLVWRSSSYSTNFRDRFIGVGPARTLTIRRRLFWPTKVSRLAMQWRSRTHGRRSSSVCLLLIPKILRARIWA